VQMRKQCDNLRRLCANDAKEEEAVERVEKLASGANASLYAARKSFESGDKIEAMQNWLTVRKALSEVYGIIDKELAHQTLIQQQQSDEHARTRAAMEWLLIFGSAGSVVLVIFLSLSFNRDTTERLNLLMQNTMRLASDQPLHPQLRGGDEMASLDR